MNPVLVNVYRNGLVESSHSGRVVVVDQGGQVIFQLGDIYQDMYPRSALKYFQAIPLIESGAADFFNLTDRQIALACASHNGEQQHVDPVNQWLNDLGLNQKNLENGPALPFGQVAREEYLAQGGKPDRIYHNCSGKHTAMLALSCFLNLSCEGYSEYDHPTQQLWMKAVSELLDIDTTKLIWERDGCGLPALALPLLQLARASALYANLDRVSANKAAAMARIVQAVRHHPELVAGSDRCCTAVIRETAGNVMVKTGAEGVYMGFIPEQKRGFALKIDDGASRASEVALGALLNKLEILTIDEQIKLQLFFQPEVRNSQNIKTGKIIPSDVW